MVVERVTVVGSRRNIPQPNLSFQTAVPLGDDVIAIAGTPYGDTPIHIFDLSTGTGVRNASR